MGATGLIDRSKMDAAFLGLSAAFNIEIAKPSIVDLIATRLPSTAASEQYPHLGSVPAPTEWKGDRRMDELAAYAQTVANVDYANGIRMPINDINDDRLGLVGMKVRQLAGAFKRFLEKLVVDVLNAGHTTKCYDGQNLLDTTHVSGASGTQSNYASGGGSNLSSTSFATAKAAMRGFKDDVGVPIGIEPDTLLVGSALEDVALNLIEAQNLASGASNVYFRGVKLIVSPFVTSSTAWYLLDTTHAMRAVLLQEREPVSFTAQDNPSDAGMFDRKEARYGAQWRGAAAPGLWFAAYGSAGA